MKSSDVVARGVALAALAALTVACPSSAPAVSGSSPPPMSAAPTSTPTSAPTSTPPPSPTTVPSTAPTAAGWLGPWKSATCGPRTYVRKVSFAPEGIVTGSELVSPCPPKVRCVWSGIVNWKGTYEVKGDKIALTVAIDGGPKGKVALPTELTWDAAKDALSETSGDAVCVYARDGKK